MFQEHFESTSRHGSLVHEWSKEEGNQNDISPTLLSSANEGNNNHDPSSASSSTQPTTTTTKHPDQNVEMDHQQQQNNNDNNNNQNSVPISQLLQNASSPQILQERIQNHFIPFQVVGILLFNPTISIDDDTSEANILFSERRYVWGSNSQNTNPKDHIAHAVPNHAGLCSGFKGLASIFCKPSFASSSSSSSSSSSNNNKSTNCNNSSASKNKKPINELPGVRYVTQVKGFHVFVAPEPNFYLVITIERPTSHVSSDALVVDEITNWSQTFIDSIRVVHGSFSKMWNTCLEHQRKTVNQIVQQQQQQHNNNNNHGNNNNVIMSGNNNNNNKSAKPPSAKKIESRARVSAARDVCTKVAPLCHNLYNFLNEQLKILYGGPCMLSCTNNLHSISTQQGISNNSFRFDPTVISNNNTNGQSHQPNQISSSLGVGTLKRPGSSSNLSSSPNNVPDFGSALSSSTSSSNLTTNNNNLASSANISQQQQQFLSAVVANNNNNNNNAGGNHIINRNGTAATSSNPNSLPQNQFSAAVPLFGPLSLASSPHGLRMSASITCARLLDAHISILRHVIILDAMSVLSPLSRTSLAPTIIASSLPPSAVSSVLSAIALYKPPTPGNSNNNNNQNVQNSSSSTASFIPRSGSNANLSGNDLTALGGGGTVVPSSGGGNGTIGLPLPPSSVATAAIPSPTNSRTEQQLLQTVRVGSCRFLRVAKLKGDGSEEVTGTLNSSMGISNNQTTKKQQYSSPSEWGTSRGVRPQPSSSSSPTGESSSSSQKPPTSTATSEKSGNFFDSTTTDLSQYERNELWLFQLGPHLVVCCEAKSSLLSVPGSRLSIIQEICHFLSGGNLVMSSSAPNNNNNNNNNKNEQQQQNQNQKDEVLIHDAEDSQAEKNRKIVQRLLASAEEYFTQQQYQNRTSGGLVASIISGGNGSSSHNSKNSSSPYNNQKTGSGSNQNGKKRTDSISSSNNGGEVDDIINDGNRNSSGSSNKTNVAAATVDDFPHFLENSSLRIGTANTQTKWFPPSQAEVKHALAAANVANQQLQTNSINNHDHHQKRRTSVSQQQQQDESNNNNLNSLPQNPRQLQRARQMQLALQVSTLKPQDDDLTYGPPSFILKNMLHSQVENNAVRQENLAFAQRNLAQQQQTTTSSKKRHQQETTTSSSPLSASSSSATFPSKKSIRKEDNGNNNKTNNNNKDQHQRHSSNSTVRFDPSPPKEYRYFDYDDDLLFSTSATTENNNYSSQQHHHHHQLFSSTSDFFSSDDQAWFTRGGSTYGNSILSLITDRQQTNSKMETVREKAGGNKTIQRLLSDDAACESSNNDDDDSSSLLYPSKQTSTLEGGGGGAHASSPLVSSVDFSSVTGGNQIDSNNPSSPNTNNNNNNQKTLVPTSSTPSLMTTLLVQRQERWAFASADGDRVAGIVDNLALNGDEAAETGRRALRMFGMHNAVNL